MSAIIRCWAVFLTATVVLAGCGKRPATKPPTPPRNQVIQSTNTRFEDNLPAELREACHLMAMEKVSGGGCDRLGYAKAVAYTSLDPDDARGFYLTALGSLSLGDLGLASDSLNHAIRIGLPKKQAGLAKETMDALATLQKSRDFKERVTTLFKAQGAMLDDVRRISSELPKDSASVEESSDIETAWNVQDTLADLLPSGSRRYSHTAAAELEFYPYGHSSEVEQVAGDVFEKVRDLEAMDEHMESANLVKTGIRLVVNFIANRQEQGRGIEAVNAANVLFDQLMQDSLPTETMLPPERSLRSRMMYYLGEDEGERAFRIVGGAIARNRDWSGAKKLWPRFSAEERELFTKP